jgi:hypothetical protein
MGEHINIEVSGEDIEVEPTQQISEASHYPPGLLFMRLEPVPLEGPTMDTARRTESFIKDETDVSDDKE